ncbi:MAG: acyl-CoA thioesterase [Bacillota bacterium]
MINETIISVRFNECGAHGIVHHSNYNCWLEAAQFDLFKKHDTDYVSLLEEGYYFPMIRLNVDFASPARLGDEVCVRLWIKELGRVKIVFAYEIVRTADQRLIARATSEHVFLTKDFKPADIKRAFPELYESFRAYLK